ncbi:MAG TPA: hypothetical protein VK699_05455 [Terriglobales bacterium]|jgi:hypothetical protein|nr:hypothetical protein [Terriglobales bacterium]
MMRYWKEHMLLAIPVLIVLGTIWLFHECAYAQDHGPALEQCVAYGSLWAADAKDAATGTLSVSELTSRGTEMNKCSHAYPGESIERGWESVSQVYIDALGARYLSFIKRHNLKEQFLTEDAEGKR